MKTIKAIGLVVYATCALFAYGHAHNSFSCRDTLLAESSVEFTTCKRYRAATSVVSAAFWPLYIGGTIAIESTYSYSPAPRDHMKKIAPWLSS